MPDWGRFLGRKVKVETRFVLEIGRWRIWLAYTTYSEAFKFYNCKILTLSFT